MDRCVLSSSTKYQASEGFEPSHVNVTDVVEKNTKCALIVQVCLLNHSDNGPTYGESLGTYLSDLSRFGQDLTSWDEGEDFAVFSLPLDATPLNRQFWNIP